MVEKVAVFDMVEAGPNQRVNHAHIRGDLVHLHVHGPGKEPKEPEALVLSRWDLWRVMDVNYWKEELTLTFEPSDETNAVGAEVGLRSAVFTWKKGKQTKEDEVTFHHLRQVDARVRFRVRDVRGVPEDEMAGLPPGYKEHERLKAEKEEREKEEETPAEAAEEGEEEPPESAER